MDFNIFYLNKLIEKYKLIENIANKNKFNNRHSQVVSNYFLNIFDNYINIKYHNEFLLDLPKPSILVLNQKVELNDYIDCYLEFGEEVIQTNKIISGEAIGADSSVFFFSIQDSISIYSRNYTASEIIEEFVTDEENKNKQYFFKFFNRYYYLQDANIYELFEIEHVSENKYAIKNNTVCVNNIYLQENIKYNKNIINYIQNNIKKEVSISNKNNFIVNNKEKIIFSKIRNINDLFLFQVYEDNGICYLDLSNINSELEKVQIDEGQTINISGLDFIFEHKKFSFLDTKIYDLNTSNNQAIFNSTHNIIIFEFLKFNLNRIFGINEKNNEESQFDIFFDIDGFYTIIEEETKKIIFKDITSFQIEGIENIFSLTKIFMSDFAFDLYTIYLKQCVNFDLPFSIINTMDNSDIQTLEMERDLEKINKEVENFIFIENFDIKELKNLNNEELSFQIKKNILDNFLQSDKINIIYYFKLLELIKKK